MKFGISKILGFGKSSSGETVSPRDRSGRSFGVVRLSYDAAQTNDNNENHWKAADSLSADAANSEEVRKVLRERGRYEYENNSYVKGIVKTRANDVVGRGPRLQVRTGNEELDKFIETEFKFWAKREKLAKKLKQLRRSKIHTGEGFVLLANGPETRKNVFDPNEKPNSVRLQLRMIEADQVATPGKIDPDQTGQVSGIVHDQYGRPTHYHILNQHPGDQEVTSYSADDKRTVPARDIIHYFDADRAGQSRGIPEITPALPLVSQLRRLTLATLTASENLANIPYTIETNAPPEGESEAVNTMEVVPVERGEALVMPEGWGLKQPKPEQPVSTYKEFKKELIAEFGNCLNMPYNIAAGDSSSHNYASGRLDRQGYVKVIGIEQDELNEDVCDRIFDRWFDQAILMPNYMPQEARKSSFRAEMETTWYWDGSEHVDPVKEANGQAIRLENNLTTLADECARTGRDWRDVLKQRAKERKLMDELGLTTDPGSTQQTPPDDEDEDEAEEVDQTQGNAA